MKIFFLHYTALLFFRTAENVTLLQLSGNFVLPTMHTHQAIPYKYAIGRKKGKKKNNGPNPEGEVEYEFLKKGRHGGIVNRILLLPNSFRGCDKGMDTPDG